MTTLRLALAALAAALGLSVPSAAAQPPSGIVRPADPESKPLLELGEQLYAGNCATCHGEEGRGVATPRPGGGGGGAPPPRPGEGVGHTTRLGPPLRGVGERAADFYLDTGYMPLGDPYEQPRRGRVLFSQRELDALVAYVGSLGGGPPIPEPRPERGNLAEGLMLFTENCAGCHQVVGEGGYVTDAVAPPLEAATAVQVAEAVRIGPYYMPRFTEEKLSDAQLDSVIAYVQASKNPVDEGGWGIGHIGPVPEGLVAWLVAGVALVALCVVIGERGRRP